MKGNSNYNGYLPRESVDQLRRALGRVDAWKWADVAEGGGAAPVRETEWTEASSGQVGPSKWVFQVIGGKMPLRLMGFAHLYHWLGITGIYVVCVCVCSVAYIILRKS